MSRTIIIFSFIFLSLISFYIGYRISNNSGLENGYKARILIDRFNDLPKTTEKPKKIISIAPNIVISSTLNGNRIRYVTNKGQIYESDIKSLVQKPILDKSFFDIVGVMWSPDFNSAIYLFNRSDGNRFSYLNFEAGIIKNLDYNIDALGFSLDGLKVAYATKSGTEGIITVQHLESGDYKKIANTRLKVSALIWIADDMLYLKSSDSHGSSSFLLTLDGKLTKIIENKTEIKELWSKDHKNLLLAAGNDSLTLSLFNLEKREFSDFDIKLDVEKCSWGIDNVTIFCAIPKNQSGQEELYLINTATKEKKILAELEPYITVEKLFVSEIDNYAVIQSALDHKLYRIQLDD